MGRRDIGIDIRAQLERNIEQANGPGVEKYGAVAIPRGIVRASKAER